MKTLLVDLTNKCNLRCAHCYNSRYFDLKNDSFDLAKLCDYIVQNAIEHVHILGGEPFLSDNLYPLLYFLDSKNIVSSINTNGTLLNRENVEKLKKYEQLKQITVSLDGHNAKTNDAIRGPSIFKKVYENMKSIKNNCQLSNIIKNLAFVVTPENIESLYYLNNVADELGFNNILVSFLYYQGNAKTISRSYDYEAVADGLVSLIHSCSNLKIDVVIDAKPIFLDYLKIISNDMISFDNIGEKDYGCYALKGYTYMSVCNEVFPCSPSSFYGDKYKLDRSEDISNSLSLLNNNLCEKNCPYNRLCKKCPLDIKCGSTEFCDFTLKRIKKKIMEIMEYKVKPTTEYGLLVKNKFLYYLNFTDKAFYKICSFNKNEFDYNKTIRENISYVNENESEKYYYNFIHLIYNKKINYY